MNNNSWFKKEKPLLSLQSMSGGAAGSLMQGAAAAKTYVDEVFSTLLYTGNASDKTITNSIDLAGEGGLTWIKRRNGGSDHALVDTVRGASQYLSSNNNYANTATGANNNFNSFTSTGFTLKDDNGNDFFNKNNTPYSSWSFRKAPGFFDIVQYTGTGSTQTLSHSLESIPACIMVKRTDTTADWGVYHRGQNAGVDPEDYRLRLNSSTTENNDTYWGDTAPTATQFTVGDAHTEVNASGGTYIAYIFAGGASTAATARSTYHDGGNLQFSASSDIQLGTGDFTVEGWFNYTNASGTPCIFDFRSTTGSTTDCFAAFVKASTGILGLYTAGGWICDDGVEQFRNQWYHFAAVKSSGTIKLYINGTQSGSAYTTSTDFTNNTLRIGSGATGANVLYGWVSNLRVVKGTALYTSSFRPPTEPLTNVTDTKVLCCNNSSVTGGTVLPNTPSVNSSVTASTGSPFDDSEGFKFGDGGEGIIKCGNYKGNGGSAGPIVNCGWEPQWVMVKNLDSTGNWFMFDSMRGMRTGGYDAKVHANETNSEEMDHNWLDLTPTGFRLKSTNSNVNADGYNYMYVAIRRPDGYVGKPPSAATNVFALTYGVNSGVAPMFITPNIDVIDFKFYVNPVSGGMWYVSARLIEQDYWYTNSNGAPGTDTNEMYDYNYGMGSWTNDGTAVLAYLWKRNAGFDVVAYEGDGVDGGTIKHSMNQAPEMIWIKNRTSGSNTGDWMVGHKDLNAGSSPWNYYLVLNKAQQEYSDSNPFNNVAPTSTSFELDSWDRVNADGSNYLAMLFSSVTGISKVGSYTGSSSEQTITTGFQPRFVIIKNRTNTGNNWTTGWFTFDTTRGWASGANDKRMRLNDGAGQTTEDWTNPISTGFTINADSGNELNNNGEGYIYYAHA